MRGRGSFLGGSWTHFIIDLLAHLSFLSSLQLSRGIYPELQSKKTSPINLSREVSDHRKWRQQSCSLGWYWLKSYAEKTSFRHIYSYKGNIIHVHESFKGGRTFLGWKVQKEGKHFKGEGEIIFNNSMNMYE